MKSDIPLRDADEREPKCFLYPSPETQQRTAEESSGADSDRAAHAEARSAAGTVDLGSPENWKVRPRETLDGEWVSSGIAKTKVPGVAVIETRTGRKALCARCPHMKKDLNVYGYVDENGVIRCLHQGFGWLKETGVSVGAPAADIALHDVTVDENDVARACGEVLR